MAFLNLKYPIIQAPIGSAASVELVAAVSGAGALGSFAMTWTTPEDAKERIQAVRERTTNPFLVNFVLAFPLRSFDVVLDAGAPVVTFSWGQPGKLIEKAQQSGAKVGVQVGNLDGAKQALEDGADFIICQGMEAGGHVQSTSPLSALLQEVAAISADVPIVAAGGISDAQDMHRAMKNGANAIMMGTRFVATHESLAHPLYKQAIVDAMTDDSVSTLCFEGGWPYASHRVLRNNTLTQWEAAGCPPVGQRPNENEVICTQPNGSVVKRYSDTPALATMSGQVMDCCLYAGAGCGGIQDIPDAQTLINRVWQEYTGLIAKN